jgi:hypothetical protein
MQIFITDWWLCPELYLRRPFHFHGSSRLDILLESRAKQGVQVFNYHNIRETVQTLFDELISQWFLWIENLAAS